KGASLPCPACMNPPATPRATCSAEATTIQPPVIPRLSGTGSSAVEHAQHDVLGQDLRQRGRRAAARRVIQIERHTIAPVLAQIGGDGAVLAGPVPFEIGD